MISVLISIKPKWCELIASGKKTIEVRKTKPKSDVPFKCYMYCTKDMHNALVVGNGEAKVICCTNLFTAIPCGGAIGNGKVIGEFVCNGFEDFRPTENGVAFKHFLALKKTCLSLSELKEYLKGKDGHGWRISDLKVYDEPKELSEFRKPELPTGLRYEVDVIKRPPQSWCYVEDMT